MEELLEKVNSLVDSSTNIPEDIKDIVKTICRAYIRESKGKISIDGIINVCNTKFRKLDENDLDFLGENKILADTETNYDEECNVIHKINYLNCSDYIKLISILTHEIGHVITESKPCEITETGLYPLAKRTTTFYENCKYENSELYADKSFGFRMADGFLEFICTKIFESQQFRQELLQNGYDLKDYCYKDERIFSSRVYDEYKACFELFDYIMDGALFDFSCMTFNSNEDMINFINKHKLNIIFEVLDKSNDSLWLLKKFEGKERSSEFISLLKNFVDNKKVSIELSSLLLPMYGKNNDDEKYKKLLYVYENTLLKQKLLPIESVEKQNK